MSSQSIEKARQPVLGQGRAGSRMVAREERDLGKAIDRGVRPVQFCEWEASVAGQEGHEPHATINCLDSVGTRRQAARRRANET